MHRHITRMQVEPHWTNYVAIVTGTLGAVTGIVGSIMGYIAYRRSNEIKKSDRRIVLHQLRNEVQIAITELSALLPEALKSRKAILNARGLLHSSIMREFSLEHKKDAQLAEELSMQFPPETVQFDRMSLQEIEQELVKLDRTKGRINALLSKYRISLQKDFEQLRDRSAYR